MAENLNYNASGSKCYDNSESNCNTYGRLYDWSTAMDFPSSCNSSDCSSQIQFRHRGICPNGWHIPSDDDWDVLMNYVGGSSTAGRYLKATGGVPMSTIAATPTTGTWATTATTPTGTTATSLTCGLCVASRTKAKPAASRRLWAFFSPPAYIASWRNKHFQSLFVLYHSYNIHAIFKC